MQDQPRSVHGPTPQIKASEEEYESTSGKVPLRPRALLFPAELMIGENSDDNNYETT